MREPAVVRDLGLGKRGESGWGTRGMLVRKRWKASSQVGGFGDRKV